jgi:hypothetical protein
MPVKQITRHDRIPAEGVPLLQKLVAEWQSPDPSATQPLIVEERDNPDGSFHVYVVWDAWWSRLSISGTDSPRPWNLSSRWA